MHKKLYYYIKQHIRYKRIFIISIILIIIPLELEAQAVFHLNWLCDTTLLLAGTSLNIAQYKAKYDYGKYHYKRYDKDSVPFFDRQAVQKYNWHLDKAADITVGISCALPLVCVIDSPKNWTSLCVMYAEVALLSNGTKELCKALVSRKRPYMYTSNIDSKGVKGRDWKDSFPSGHATMAFAGAAFTSYTFCLLDERQWAKWTVILTSFSIATGTATLRVASGNHFISDTLVGAGVGTFWGILVPFLHTLGKNNYSNTALLKHLNLTGESISLKFFI